MTQPKQLLMLAVLALAALLAATWMLWSTRMPVGARAGSPAITTLSEPRALGEFTLRDDHDEQFDLADLRGHWSFLFFGYTSCPDVCPTTLVDLAHVRKAIIDAGGSADELQVVLVSVDPHRDTNAVIGPYVRHFDPSFRAATGSAAQLENLARQLGVSYRVDYVEGATDYPVQHSAAVFLIDPQARFHGMASPPFDARSMARRFLEIRAG